MLVLFCVLNEEVQEAWKLACLGKKGQSEEAARSTQVGGHLDCWGLAACWEMRGWPFFTEVWEGRSFPVLHLIKSLCLSPCFTRAPIPTTIRRCLRRAGSSVSPWGLPPSHR